jgi:hypothetical protein
LGERNLPDLGPQRIGAGVSALLLLGVDPELRIGVFLLRLGRLESRIAPYSCRRRGHVI